MTFCVFCPPPPLSLSLSLSLLNAAHGSGQRYFIFLSRFVFAFLTCTAAFVCQVQSVIKKKWQRFRLSRSVNNRVRRRSSRTSSVFLSQTEVLFMVSFRNKVFNKRRQSRDYSKAIEVAPCTCLAEHQDCTECSKVQQYG